MRSLIFVVLLVAAAAGFAQEKIGSTNIDAEKFARELTSSPAAKRTELLAAHDGFS